MYRKHENRSMKITLPLGDLLSQDSTNGCNACDPKQIFAVRDSRGIHSTCYTPVINAQTGKKRIYRLMAGSSMIGRTPRRTRSVECNYGSHRQKGVKVG
jgi:hypothetical protein